MDNKNNYLDEKEQSLGSGIIGEKQVKIPAIKLIGISTILCIFLVFIDQITKYLVINALSVGESIPVITGFLEILCTVNTGAAFSFLNNYPWVFLILVPVVFLILLIFFIKIPRIKQFLPIHVLLVFLMAGAIGNYIDRLYYGYVRDFIYIKLIDFPVFNVADIYVTLGIIALIFLMFFKYKDSDFK